MKIRGRGSDARVRTRRWEPLPSRLALNFLLSGVGVIALLVGVAYVFLLFQYRSLFDANLINLVQVTAMQIDPELHAGITQSEDQFTPDYEVLTNRLRMIRDLNLSPVVDDIYTMRLQPGADGKPKQIVFVLDSLSRGEKDFVEPMRIFVKPGPVLVANFSTMKTAMIEEEPYTDEYGTWISAYMPVFSNEGQLECVVGVDVAAADMLAVERRLLGAALGFFVVALAALGLAGWLTGRRVMAPLADLTAGAQRLVGGDLEYTIPISREDEFGVLIQLFNALAARLRQTLAQMDQQVTSRTRAMELRATHLASAGEVGRILSATLNLNVLLSEGADLIARQFRFYHCGIFLMDDSGEWVELRAASSVGGRQMLSRGQRVRLGEGLVGYVAQTGQPRIAQERDGDWAVNPLLAEARSAVVLPLNMEGRILGVLELQSVEVDAFSGEVVANLRMLAEYLAVALNNAFRFQDQQRALAALQEANRTEIRRGWQNWFGDLMGYRYTPSGITSIVSSDRERTEVADRVRLDKAENCLYIPIRVLGMPLGTLKMEREMQRPWTMREVEFLSKASEEIGQVMENARLFETARRRAAREQLTGEITAQIRTSAEVSTILQTSLRTLGRTLRATQGMIWLESDAEAPMVDLETGYDGQVKLGIIASLSGKYVESSGKPTIEGAQLAVRAINEVGGLTIEGRHYQVVLLAEDDRAEPELAIAAARKLLGQSNLLGVIGPQFSRNAVPVAELAEEARTLMISPMSTNPKTTAGRRYVFRIGFVDDFQGQAMARFAYTELKARRAAILYDEASEYNRTIAAIFRQAFTAVGGEIAADEAYITGETNYVPMLTRIRESRPDVLFLPNYPDELAVQLDQAAQLGLKVRVLGSDSWDGFKASNSTLLEGGFYTHHWHRSSSAPASQEFVRIYRRTYDREPRITAALTYDAVMMLFQAVQNKDSMAADQVQQGLRQMVYEGVSGTLRYEIGGDPAKAVVIMRFQGGQPEFYKLLEPA